jgi:UDP-N-acetylmuramoyl-tripeptide--D-alanyl-D-alanine ligase
MRLLCKIILQYYLKIIVKIVLFVHRPMIIAVAGSVNKTFVRNEVQRVLHSEQYHVRSNPKNFNTEIGLPLAILNIGSGYNSYRRWIPVMYDAACAIFQKDFPDCLVLELGVAKRGDMRYLLSLVSPRISIITDITQRYIESFSGMDHLIGEYAYLVKKTSQKGCVLLNWDNERVRALQDVAVAPVIFFGATVTDVEHHGKIVHITRESYGMRIELCYKTHKKEVHIPRFGDHHAIASLVGWIVSQEIDNVRS